MWSDNGEWVGYRKAEILLELNGLGNGYITLGLIGQAALENMIPL